MSEAHRHHARAVGYALNVFPYHTLPELWQCLATDVLALKARAFPDGSFPIELRFSEPLVRELARDCDQVARLKYFLDTHDLALVTVNAFVMPRFHGAAVKEKVYLPAWHESDARARFTCDSLDLLAQLAPSDIESASVSAPFGALKPVPLNAIAPNILRCGEHARRLRERTGIHCVVALEPEPGLNVETTGEVVEFFERFVPDALRPYLGVNFDLAHQLVAFENLADSIVQLQNHGVRIAKLHVSNAAELPAPLQPFYRDSIYLHQVCGVDVAGRRAFFSLDWPTQPPPAGIVKFRVHYHLPVFPTEMPSTLRAVEHFLSSTLPSLPASMPAIIETYTWPEQLREGGSLVDNIAQELNWVRRKISLE